MNKTYLAIAAVIVILAIGFIVMNSNKKDKSADTTKSTDTSTQSTDEKTANTTIVTYSDAGFSPKSVTVNKGEVVTFVNESDNNLWVASNPHPVHTGLSGFDARKNIKKGESYSFTFTQVGSWSYHNHSNSSDTGTVVVQ